MLRSLCIPFLIAFVFCSCGSDVQEAEKDSTSSAQTTADTNSGPMPYEKVHGNLTTLLPKLTIPDWIDVDSIRSYSIEVAHADVATLFPAGFGVPDDVFVTAFATHTVDSSTHAIWYRMQLQGSDNKDIWVVLYDNAGPVAQYCPATKGVGYGYAKIDSPASFRQVFIENGGKTAVTTKVVTMSNGHFAVSNEQTSATLPENFFK